MHIVRTYIVQGGASKLAPLLLLRGPILVLHPVFIVFSLMYFEKFLFECFESYFDEKLNKINKLCNDLRTYLTTRLRT